jgi:hypothetical protein
MPVSAAIMFNVGIMSCLEYLEAVPWFEDEKENVNEPKVMARIKTRPLLLSSKTFLLAVFPLISKNNLS